MASNVESDVVELASSCHLPHPVSESHNLHPMQHHEKVLRSHHLNDPCRKTQVAPYQALPVVGPLITHHKATVLPVNEPHPEKSDEVSLGLCVCAGAHRATGRRAPDWAM